MGLKTEALVKNILKKLTKKILRQRLHGIGSFWNRCKIGTDKPRIYTGPGGSGIERISYLVPNGSTFKGDPIWTGTGPV